MNTHKTAARIVGVLFIIGTVSGVLSVVFGGTLIDDPDYLVEIAANENQFIVGALFILIMALALAMVPVVMYPISKKYNETLALGYVLFRGALETVTYFAGVISWLMLVSLSQEYVEAGAADASYFHSLGTLIKDAAVSSDHISGLVFSLGALMFYYVLYRSRLVPRWLSGWGLIGATLVVAVGPSSLFGASVEFLWAPLALQEMVLAVWLIVKGFDPSAIAAGEAATDKS